VDKLTYEAWQGCDHPDLGPRLRELVTISPVGSGDDTFAQIALADSGCLFLSGGLCDIHAQLGEQYLSTACSTYPRVVNRVDDVLQRSLALSCPEAARLVLLNPTPMEFDEDKGPQHARVPLRISALHTANNASTRPYGYFHEIRALVIWLLQYRADPLWKRLVIVASFCDRLHQLAAPFSEVPQLLQEYRDIAERNLFGDALSSLPPRPALQLELVLELIVQRISSDFTPPRFLECYREFMQGIGWTSQSSMEEIAGRYAHAFAEHYAPFMCEHEYMLEHWLVSYIHRTLFPLGPQEHAREPGDHPPPESVRDQCLMLLVHNAIVQTLLIGVAGVHQSSFAVDQVIRGVQSSARTFEHSLSFSAAALKILAEKGVRNCVGLAMLTRL